MRLWLNTFQPVLSLGGAWTLERSRARLAKRVGADYLLLVVLWSPIENTSERVPSNVPAASIARN